MLGALIDVVLIAALAGLVWFVFAERRRFEVELGRLRGKVSHQYDRGWSRRAPTLGLAPAVL